MHSGGTVNVGAEKCGNRKLQTVPLAVLFTWCVLHTRCVTMLLTCDKPNNFFTARCYASAVLAMALCPSVRLSVTSRCSTKTAKRMITQTTPHDSPGTLVSWRRRFPRNSTGVTPTGAPNAGEVGQNRRLSTNSRLYLENGRPTR